MVAPGFYEGFYLQQPYNWMCPPPGTISNQKPGSGHLDINLIDGKSEASSAFPSDAQIVFGFLPGALDATGRTTIAVDITPLAECPQPPGIRFVTNIYRVTATAPLIKAANVLMLYSSLKPDPSAIYLADDPSGPWRSIGASPQAQQWTIHTTTQSLGYFAAGYSSTAPPPGLRIGGPILPIVVAALIVLVLIAGIPLAILRRRGTSSIDDEPRV
jgi:hypothetical protein